jgi:D-sedoheptulose 7-phosphate isomerase
VTSLRSAPAALAVDLAAGLDEHLQVATAARDILPALAEVEAAVLASFASGGRLFAFGNGGSAADAQHLAAELVGRFLRPRAPLSAIALTTDTSTLTGIGNDFSFEDVFARQVAAHAQAGDVVIAFSTSGGSENVVRGLAAAREAGATAVLFTGRDGGRARAEADLVVAVPSATTARIQEVHALFIHLLSDRIDAWAAEERPA